MAPRPDRAKRIVMNFPGDPPNVAPTGEGAWVARSPMPKAAYRPRACVVDGRIVVIASSNEIEPVWDMVPFVFDPLTDSWRTGSHFLLLGNIPTYSAACSFGGKVYLIGGDDEYDTYYRVVTYDPQTDRWEFRRDMPTRRTCPAAVVVEGLIYAIGGFGGNVVLGNETPVATVEVYDPVSNLWQTNASLPQAIAYPYACAVDGVIYVFGADDGSVFAYDPQADLWVTKIAHVDAGMCPEAVEVVDGQIYLMEPTATVVYDPRRDRVSVKRPMSTMRYDVASAQIDGRIHIMGGSARLIEFDDDFTATEVLATHEVLLPYSLPPRFGPLPTAQMFDAAGVLDLSVAVDPASGPCTFQWFKDGVAIAGATSATFTLPCVQRFHAGSYAVAVTNQVGTVTSDASRITVNAPPPNDARLLNVSTRALCRTGDQVLIPGFVIEGRGTKRMLIRAVGPTLGLYPFDLENVLGNPQLALKHWNGTAYVDIAGNNDWRSNANVAGIVSTTAAVGAFPLIDDLDAALLVDLAPGQYSVIANCAGGSSGVAIVEFYDADSSSAGSARLVNLSNRGFAGVGDDVMIPGFVISDEGPKSMLVRVIGPTLGAAPYGVTDAMADPRLALYRDEVHGANTLLLTQDNWSEHPDAANTVQVAAEVGAFALAPGSKDAAFVITLQPGVYTVVGSSVDGVSTGVVLVEIYVVE